jgi:protein-S-isoprenylcysteine O-methyltransferase Ste14
MLHPGIPLPGTGGIVSRGAVPCRATSGWCRSERAPEGDIGHTAYFPRVVRVRGIPQPDRFGKVRESRAPPDHRLLFTAYSLVAFLLLVLYLRTVPDHPLYRLEGGVRLLFYGAQACGAALLFWTPWDVKEFLGIRQWKRQREGNPPEPGRNDRLFTKKAYGLVRHPLYLGISAVLAFQPVQTRNSFLSVVLIVLYFYVGSFFEERRMVRTFGEEYRKYQKRVPRFLPVRWPRNGVS